MCSPLEDLNGHLGAALQQSKPAGLMLPALGDVQVGVLMRMEPTQPNPELPCVLSGYFCSLLIESCADAWRS
jgi:hypothetical protein